MTINVNTLWLATAEMLLTQSRIAGNGGPSLRAELTVNRTSMLLSVAGQILCTNQEKEKLVALIYE